MLESKNTQFTLSAEGQILWQEKVNNPLPGQEVAVLGKGEQPLKPVISLLDNDVTAAYISDDEKRQALINQLSVWLQWYMSESIGALVNLEVPQGVDTKDDAVSRISAKVYEGMGIVPREELEDVIANLTLETRADLRSKKIRLGPILVFVPELNKPAAVRLRALLLSLYHGYSLPAQVPVDGIVSVKIEDENVDPLYYRSIGYPIYGMRAVRIDMLDRVISCVYDHAEEGKFQARHEMAEWLGCSIEGLYKVLESMGHSKIYDPAEEKIKDEEKAGKEADLQEKPVIDEPVVDTKVEDEVSDKAENTEAVEEVEAKPTEKPELATFRLKKGKAFQSKTQGTGDRKAGKSFSNKRKGDPKKAKGQDRGKAKGKGTKHKDRGPRVISVEAKVSEEDNPFAILKQLKK